MTTYYRPIATTDRAQPSALLLAGGPVRFAEVECLSRDAGAKVIPAADLPDDIYQRLTAERPPICGLSLDQVRIMAILNVTPDSFSDGGQHGDGAEALTHAKRLIDEGADILDIGGESTRPGASFVETQDEIARTQPAIEAVRRISDIPISIDTRKAAVAQAAIKAGAGMFNDVSALQFDPESLRVAAQTGVPVCLMHSGGDPETMQDDPRYDDVLLDVYDSLAERIAECEAAGIPRARIIVDPGIGFGKTQAHNLALIRGLSLFHGLGCAILLGVSRKRLIGQIGQEPEAMRRLPGSLAIALEGMRQGVQMLRVHDMAETKQAVRLWQAML